MILAAGKGTRMRSERAKVLHTLSDKSFLGHVVDRAQEMEARATHIVIGHQAEQIRDAFLDRNCDFCEQTEQLGTGHAVLQALPSIPNDSKVLILYGDVPLIKTGTLNALCKNVNKQQLGLLTVTLNQPAGYGRIVRNKQNEVTSIVEQKDASREQLKITEVNTGLMCVDASLLKTWLPQLKNSNAQSEYYLTDIIQLAREQGISIHTCQPSNESEVMGVNSRLQQMELERIFQKEQALNYLNQGLLIKDASRFDCRGELHFGNDCEIDINCIFEGRVVLGDGVKISANCIIKDTTINSHTIIHENSLIEDSNIEKNCQIGPYARLRPGTNLKDKAKIGNFVETKNATVGEGSKINHLSYVGDAELGNDVNIGAGTITCNYDGANKHKTQLGDGVFVGSNSAIVAPVNVEDGATIGAGSTITQNVKKDTLTLTRSKQRHIDNWQRPTKK